MKYLFRGRWYDAPPYTSYPRCRLVEVSFALPLARVLPRDQRQMPRSVRKVWLFAKAEGIGQTARKIKSKRVQDDLTGDFHVCLALGKLCAETDGLNARGQEPDRFVACLGTRHPAFAEVMLFRDELIAPLKSLPAQEACARVIADCEQRFGGQSVWDEIGGYNFYSDDAPPPVAARVLQDFAAQIAIDETSAFRTNAAKKVEQRAEELTTRVVRLAVDSPDKDATLRRNRTRDAEKSGDNRDNVVVIAAGDYTRTQIAPALLQSGFKAHTIVDYEPLFAARVGAQFNFRRALTDWREAIEQPEIGCVIIASYHSTHTEIARHALCAGKKVFVEKPPCVTRDDLHLLLDAAQPRDGSAPFLEVGYNRRFTEQARQARELLRGRAGATTISCIIKEVEIPPAHWYHWRKEGTRITGNLCHWIDLAVFLLGGADADLRPVEMTMIGGGSSRANEASEANEINEETCCAISFADGSLVNLIATTRGDQTLGVQEWIEARRSDLTIRIDDFRRMRATEKGRIVWRVNSSRDKGHARMYAETFRRMREGESPLYTNADLRLTSLLTINAAEIWRSGERYRRLTGF